MNFSTSSSEVLVVMERFPEIVDTSLSRLRSGIEENDDFRFELFTERIEQPTMTITITSAWDVSGRTNDEPVDLFRILLLQTKNHLDGNEIVGVVGVRLDKCWLGRHGELSGVFEDVSVRLLPVDILLHHSVLVQSDRSEYTAAASYKHSI